MSSQYQGDVMENLFDEGPEGQVHFDEEGFDEDGFEAEGFDEDGFDEEGFDEDGFDEEGFDEDGFDDTPDHGDAMEMAVADALDAEDADEFFGSLFKKLKSAVPGIKSVLNTVGKVAKFVPIPGVSAIGNIASTVGGLLADEADEGEAFDDMVDLAEDEDALDAAAPIIAGLALRKAAPHVKALPITARRAAVKTVTKTVHQLARRHGTHAVAAVPAIVHTAKRHLAARRLPATQLPAMIRKVAAHAHRNPRVLKSYVKRGRAMVASGTGHHRHHAGRHHRAGGYGGTYGGTYGGGRSGAIGRGRSRYGSGGTRTMGGVSSYGSVGGAAGRCAHCGKTQRLRFNGPIQLIIKPL